MEKRFKEITLIDTEELYKEISAYVDTLINEATDNGFLAAEDADNEYTREISRLGNLCADYESLHFKPQALTFKSPLLRSIENELEKRSIKHREAAKLLEVKESTFSQIMTGKRSVSMRMAKRLYEKLNIDPKLIIEYS